MANDAEDREETGATVVANDAEAREETAASPVANDSETELIAKPIKWADYRTWPKIPGIASEDIPGLRVSQGPHMWGETSL